MASENEKTVHQQSITEVIAYLESDRAWPDHEPPGVDTRDGVLELIDEVHRLRAEETAWVGIYERHTNQLRETIRVMSTNEGKLHAQIADLETDLTAARNERDELIAYGDGWKQQWTEMRDTMWKPAMDKLARVEASTTKFEEVALAFEEAGIADKAGTLKAAADEIRRALRD